MGSSTVLLMQTIQAVREFSMPSTSRFAVVLMVTLRYAIFKGFSREKTTLPTNNLNAIGFISLMSLGPIDKLPCATAQTLRLKYSYIKQFHSHKKYK